MYLYTVHKIYCICNLELQTIGEVMRETITTTILKGFYREIINK